jgi:predicted Zn-dependent protease
MAERVIAGTVALAAGIWLAAGLHSARLESRGQAIASRPPTQLSAGQVGQAVSLFERSRPHNPDTRPMVFEAGLLARRGQRAKALGLLQDVVGREPQNATAWAVLSIVAGSADPALAQRAATRARALNPLVAQAR